MDINLVMFKKSGTRKEFNLPSNITILGRRQDCDLCIPLMVVSRRHCQLKKQEDALFVRDLGSKNGTFVNGKKIEDQMPLNPGDYIQIGPLTFTIQIDGRPIEVKKPDTAIIQSPPDISEADESVLGLNDTFGGEATLDGDQHSATEMFDSFDENKNMN